MRSEIKRPLPPLPVTVLQGEDGEPTLTIPGQSGNPPRYLTILRKHAAGREPERVLASTELPEIYALENDEAGRTTYRRVKA